MSMVPAAVAVVNVLRNIGCAAVSDLSAIFKAYDVRGT
jgi:hypothetical protein